MFFFFIIGAAGMWFISCDWDDKILVLGWLGIISSSVTLLCWWGINRWYQLKIP